MIYQAIARLAEAPPESPTLRQELSEAFVEASLKYGDGGDFMLADIGTLATRVLGQGQPRDKAPSMAMPSPEVAKEIRHGFIRTGGDSLYTKELVREDNRLLQWLQWLKWTPGAFLTTFGVSYPWQWMKAGRLDLMRMTMGFESLGLLVMLPFGLRGAWRAVRSWNFADLLIAALFFMLATALGLIVINIGTLVRLRLSVVFLLLVLAGAGLGAPVTNRRQAS